MMKNENKQLKTILKNENPVLRFHLLQLWMIDVFTKSLSDTSEGLNNLIFSICEPKTSESIDETFNKITKLKGYIIDYNNKLKQTSEQLKHVKTYQKIINSLLNDNEIKPNNENDKNEETIAHIIDTNEHLIDAINKLSIDDLKRIMSG
jgi:hypothetical protein